MSLVNEVKLDALQIVTVSLYELIDKLEVLVVLQFYEQLLEDKFDHQLFEGECIFIIVRV